MEHKKEFLLLVLLCSIVTAYSQINNFDLSKYKLPNLERRTLETSFQLNNNYSHENQFSTHYSEPLKTNLSNFNGDGSLIYKCFLNNEQVQRNTDIGLVLNSYFYDRKLNNDYKLKANNTNNMLYYKRDNRRYFKSKWFFESDIDLTYVYAFRENRSERYFDTLVDFIEGIEKRHLAFASVPLKIGYGRIEPVGDARHATYLLKELSKIDRVSSELSNEEIIEFTEFISELKNERFFDFRKRKIEELELLDSFLLSKEYVKTRDASYFATLNDYWLYGNEERLSGTRIALAIHPGYYFQRRKYNQESSSDDYNSLDIIHTGFLNAGIEFNHEKPVKVCWQHSFNLNTYFGFVKGVYHRMSIPGTADKEAPVFQSGLDHSIAFYPNTRTSVKLGYTFDYFHFFTEEDPNNVEIDGDLLELSTILDVVYYISPKIRLNVSYDFSYAWDSSSELVRENVNGSYANIEAMQDFLYSRSPDQSGRFLTSWFDVRFTYSIF